MKSIFKHFILLWTILFSNFLFADGTTTYVSISNASSISESSASSQKMTFTVTLSESPFLFATVNYATANGTATAGSDYVSQSGSLTFLPFQTTKTIEVDIVDDTLYEGDEYLYVNINTSDSGYVVSDSSGYGYILDNELEPLELTLHNRLENESDSNWVLNFTARLNQPAPSGGVTVTYETQNNSAIAGDDYISSSGTVTIPAGSVDGYIPVTIIGDTVTESTENFMVKITSISTGTIVRDTATGTIYDDDTIKVDISSSDVQEGNSGDNNQMPFRIFLTKAYPLTTPLTINYQTQDGSTPSATAGSDYTAQSGSVTFNQGDIEKIVNVPIIGDDEIEPDENLKMIISGSSYIIDSDSESEIINDDGSYPGIAFDTTDFSITEGDSGQKNLNFTFTLDAPALAGTSFEYYTQDDEATVANSDYEAISTTTYTVPEGATTITIPVKINGDTDIENDETFYLKIQNEVKLTVHGHTAKGHILNDDGSFPALSFDSNSISMTEGDSGYKDFNFTLTLDADALAGSSFKYYTQDGTAQSSDSDYEAIPHTTYNIPEGERQITIPVKVNGDTAIESDETFYFKIFDEQNITIASSVMSATATILNDDGELPEFSIEAPIVAGNEGDSGTQNVHFSIKLDAPATQDGVSIDYQTLDGTATTSDNDYNSITPTTVTFNTGESEKSFFVTINGDVKIENDETFDIQLLNPQSANIAKHKESITITINNDDEHSDDPLVCDSTMYLSSSINREDDKAKGKMWLHTIDTTKNPFNFLVMNDDGSDKFYNALAYSDIDNYIYGLYKKELIRLSKTGKVISLGKVDGLPDILSTKQLFAGAIFGEHYYISGPGQDYDKIFKIKLSDKSVSEITLNTAISLLDFSFTPDGAYLHGIVDGGRLVKVDVATGVVTFIGSAHSGYQFDSSFSDKNGRFFANDSGGNGFFEFNLDTGEKLFLSASGNAEFNDGANCLKAALLFTDYSDAPESYGTPRHYIANGVFLGDEVDHDINAYTSTDALGDDSNGIDDEDGVTLTDGTDLNGSYFTPDTTQELNVKVAKAGYLNAWIDFNIDGVFNAGEQIITSQNFAAGTHTINFNIPNTVTLNTTTYIRFRFSSTPLLTATQDANDGEVEDYAVQFGSAVQPLRGTFNVERTNSNNNVINSDERNAWYTQIVGRDFDYSLVFYEEDMSAEKEIDNVTVKLELVNMESNKTLYSIERHILNTPPKSRIDITLPVDDLSRLPATKDARFRVTYGVDDAGVITQADCLSNPALCTNHRTDYARDNFAIRPESYYIVLADGNTTRRVNRDPINTTTPLRVAAGYDYNLSVIATQYRADNSIHASDDYNTSIKRVLIFQDKTNLNCADRDDNETTETFANGENSTNLLELPNAGAYKLHLKDSDWTAVDINKTIPDCTVNNADTSVNGNTLSGCNIVSNPDMNLNSYPYQFKVDFRPQSLPINGHDDFIYMSQLSSSNNNVAMQFDGNITAQSEDNTSTTNFTDGCVAYNVLLAPNATTLSEDGIDVLLQTSHHPSRSRTPVFFTRLIEYNDDNTTLESNNSLRSIDVPITIKSGRFLNENNGTTTLDIRYNINKHLSETINPVQVTFHSLDADSSDAHSEAEQSSMFIPKGHQDLDTMVRNFYFTQVAPDQINYPRVVFNSSPLIRTPLNIDIFCDKNSSYCIDTNVTTHSDVSSSPRLQEGWYLSVDHNESVDGHVTKLTPMPGIVTITPNPSSAFPIRFKSGRNGLITTKFNNCTETLHQSTITITPTTALLYNPTPLKAGEPTYTVTCTPNTPSQWTGVGDTGNIIESKPNVNSSSKIDW